MTLKEIVTTAAGCVIIVVCVALSIKAGEIYDSISQTISETQKTVDEINARRPDILNTLYGTGQVVRRIPGSGL